MDSMETFHQLARVFGTTRVHTFYIFVNNTIYLAYTLNK